MKFLSELIRKDLQEFKGYSSARHLAREGTLFLDANENPFDASQSLSSSFSDLNRYPDPQPVQLREVLSELYSCDEDQILVCRGSDEAIDLLVRGFCEPGRDEILICPPTYGVYEFSARLQGAGVTKVPLDLNDYSLELPKIESALSKTTKLVFICTPNNPTGNLVSLDDIKDLAEAVKEKSLIVVDEAYLEFTQAESAISLIKEHSNVVVLRTLSKAWGMAGLRCGSLIAHPDLIQFLKKIIAPYPMPRPVQQLAIHQLSQKEWFNEQLQLILRERESLQRQLNELRSVKRVFLSEANFILVRFQNSDRLFNYLRQKGVIVRSRANELETRDCLRITVGAPEENKVLMAHIIAWDAEHAE